MYIPGMERLILKALEKWKNSESRKPLILDGARQVGKTWVLQEFGKRQFRACAYFNCDGNDRLKEIFSGGFSKAKLTTLDIIGLTISIKFLCWFYIECKKKHTLSSFFTNFDKFLHFWAFLGGGSDLTNKCSGILMYKMT